MQHLTTSHHYLDVTWSTAPLCLTYCISIFSSFPASALDLLKSVLNTTAWLILIGVYPFVPRLINLQSYTMQDGNHKPYVAIQIWLMKIKFNWKFSAMVTGDILKCSIATCGWCSHQTAQNISIMSQSSVWTMLLQELPVLLKENKTKHNIQWPTRSV